MPFVPMRQQFTPNGLLATMHRLLEYPSDYLEEVDIYLLEAYLDGWHTGRCRQDEFRCLTAFYHWAREKRRVSFEFSPYHDGWAMMYQRLAGEHLEQLQEPGFLAKSVAVEMMRQDWRQFTDSPENIRYFPSEPPHKTPESRWRSIDEE